MRESWSSDVENGFRARMARLLNFFRPSVSTAMLATAVVVGVGAGVGALVFSWLVDTVTHLAFTTGKHFLTFLGQYYVIVVPAVGGLIVGSYRMPW